MINKTTDAAHAGRRLDQVAAELFSEYSRARLQTWIKDGHLLVNGKTAKAKDKLAGAEILSLDAVLIDETDWVAAPVDFSCIYEDEELLVIDKPMGLVVHPAAGHHQDTLVNGLLYRFPELKQLPRAGIVHRIDKDTTGLLVVAKTLTAHHSLVKQLQDKTVCREYDAIALGELMGGATIDLPIARHPHQRLKMAVVNSGKMAVTHYRIKERFSGYTRVAVQLETGRTHQIRVHFAQMNHPLLGDPLYGGRTKWPKGLTEEQRKFIAEFPRQALHATRLGLVHPVTQEYREWHSPLPQDMEQLLVVLRE